jgi:hypothetical protein
MVCQTKERRPNIKYAYYYRDKAYDVIYGIREVKVRPLTLKRRWDLGLNGLVLRKRTGWNTYQ